MRTCGNTVSHTRSTINYHPRWLTDVSLSRLLLLAAAHTVVAFSIAERCITGDKDHVELHHTGPLEDHRSSSPLVFCHASSSEWWEYVPSSSVVAAAPTSEPGTVSSVARVGCSGGPDH